MTIDNCYSLGYIRRVHATKGELQAFFDVDDTSYYKSLEHLFILLNGQLVPLALEHINIQGAKIILKFKGYNSIEESEALVGKELFLPLSFLPPLTGTQFYYHEVIGFTIVDLEKGEIGVLNDIIEASQPILKIDAAGKEVLCPLHDDLLKAIDREHKTLTLSFPDGLLELYLED